MNRSPRVTGVALAARRARLASAAVGVALVLVACSGSDAAGPASEPPVTEDSSPVSVETTTTTTSSTTTTVAAIVTDPPPVVNTVSTGSSEPAPETSSPDSLPAPTNTMFDPATPEGEVEQVALANLAAIQICAEQLPDCDVAAATRFSELQYKSGNVELLKDFNGAGYEVRNAGDYVYSVDSLEFSEDRAEALAIICIRDGSQLYAPATEAAPERIIDAGNVTRKDRYLLTRLGDVWFVTARDPIDREDGTNGGLCQ